jgi:hypothetical protein
MHPLVQRDPLLLLRPLRSQKMFPLNPECAYILPQVDLASEGPVLAKDWRRKPARDLIWLAQCSHTPPCPCSPSLRAAICASVESDLFWLKVFCFAAKLIMERWGASYLGPSILGRSLLP